MNFLDFVKDCNYKEKVWYDAKVNRSFLDDAKNVEVIAKTMDEDDESSDDDKDIHVSERLKGRFCPSIRLFTPKTCESTEDDR